jgi:hypothetical protein
MAKNRLEHLQKSRTEELQRADYAHGKGYEGAERGARASAAWLAREIEKEQNPNPPRFWRPGHP